MKKILFVASECVPFVKTGGLADVVGALPKYFDKEKYEVRVILPNYRFIPAKWKERMQFVTSFYMDMAWRSQYVGIMAKAAHHRQNHTFFKKIQKNCKNLLTRLPYPSIISHVAGASVGK